MEIASLRTLAITGKSDATDILTRPPDCLEQDPLCSYKNPVNAVLVRIDLDQSWAGGDRAVGGGMIGRMIRTN